MSTPLHVLLKANPCLEVDEADGEANPSAGHQLGQVSVLQYFQGRACSWTTNMTLDRLHFYEKFLPQLLHFSGKQGRVANGMGSAALGGTT